LARNTISPTIAEIAIRPIEADDNIDELTALLHRSYAALGNMGLNYTAVDQSPETTRKRLSRGFGFAAVDPQQRIVGTIVFYPPRRSAGSPWLERPDVAHFGQFAVDPALQRCGIGSRLMDVVEQQAREVGAKEIALDTAEPAIHLIELYQRRGYRFIEYAQWRGKSYRSVIMSKSLGASQIGANEVIGS
jgi:GNAT superfamily N-acetyltransferase